jgi:polar amino acid transport system substrate-binding protein
MAHALGKHAGKKVVIENLAFDGLIPSLKSGKIDLIISSMTATPERAQSVDFSEPYLRTGLCLLLRKGSNAKTVRDLDAPGRLVAVKQGTTGQLYAARNINPERVLVLDDEAACVLEVVQGKADGFIYDQMSIYQHWKRHPEMTRAILQPLQEEAWAAAVRKGDKALLAQVNEFLKAYRGSGGFDTLGDKYLKEQKEAFKQMGIPFFF